MLPIILIIVGILSIGVYVVGEIKGIEGIGAGGVLLFWFGFLPLFLGVVALIMRGRRGGGRH